MRQLMKAVLFGALSVAMLSGAQANEHHHGAAASSAESLSEQPTIGAAGVVKEIDLKNKKITIAHEAIPSVNWPAMTMRFTFTTPDSGVANLNVGDRVNFTFVQQGNISLLHDIRKSQP
ncbi:cation efflux system protein CusF [Brenneria populi subsp. brevivirga]|uniref:cation efflux system protein CusF n=1 Tax=Brenneria populi TaxID=1505588 RepID=UPI002E16F969|nr:cation efflux system protein CusF [Brenneria populi subsp. brevivirga]